MEMVYSKNLKKSIASMFKPESVIHIYSRDDPRQVQSHKEETVHGTCEVDYVIRDHSITRAYNPESCTKFVRDVKGYSDSDDDEFFKNRIQQQVSTDIETTYVLNSHKYIIEISTKEELTWDGASVEGMSYKQRVSNRFLITYVKSICTQTLDPISNYEFVDSHSNLIWEQNDDTMRLSSDQKTNKLKNYLIEAASYMKKDRLVKIAPGSEHDQTLNKIQPLLNNMNYEELVTFYNDIDSYDERSEETARHIFVHMTAYAGTNASSSFVKKIIMNKEVSDNEAINLLQVWASYVNEPTLGTLRQFEELIYKNDRLNPRVQQTGILSFSHLIARVLRNSKTRFDDRLELVKYLQYLENQMQQESNIKMKIIYVLALGNINHHIAVPSLYNIMVNKKNVDRLRLAAIYGLGKCSENIEDKSFVPHKNLIKILKDSTESRTVRTFAYDVLINNPHLTRNEIEEIDYVMSSDEHLKNYHWKYMLNLREADMLPTAMPAGMVETMNAKDLSMALTEKAIVQIKNSANNLINIGPFEFLKSVVKKDNLPVSLKVENVERIGKTFVTTEGIYMINNLDKFKSEDSINEYLYLDVWLAQNSWIFAVNFSNKDDDVTEPMLAQLVSKLRDYVNQSRTFMRLAYCKLKSFSIPMSSGYNAEFHHRIPTLIEAGLIVETNMEMPRYIANLQIVFNYWRHGYSGITVSNPATRLRHSARKTNLLDVSLSLNVSASFDFARNKFQISLPIMTPGYEFHQGMAGYMSSSVMTTTYEDEMTSSSCRSCGYKTLSTQSPNKPLKNTGTEEYNDIGLKMETTIYDCDVNLASMLEKMSQGTMMSSVMNSVIRGGHICIFKPNSMKTFTQLDLNGKFSMELYEPLEKPKYYLPGYYFDAELFLAGKKRDDSVLKIKGIEIISNYSLGQTFNALTIKLFQVQQSFSCLRLSENCRYVHADFQYHMPIYAINEFDEKIFFQLKGHIYLSSPYKENIVPLYKMNVTIVLKENMNSVCDRIKGNPLFMYPHQTFPTYYDCLTETVTNMNLWNFELDIVRQEEELIDSVKSNLLVIAFLRLHLIHLLSPSITTFKNEYEISTILNSNFIDDAKAKLGGDDIEIINILPGVIINENNETIIADLSKFEIIHENSEANYIIFAKVENNKLFVKIYHDQHYLKLESLDNKQSNSVPTVQIDFDDDVMRQPTNDEILYLPKGFDSNSDYLFGLSQADNMSFIKIQLKKYLLIIYYSPSNTHIIYNNNLHGKYDYKCKKL